MSDPAPTTTRSVTVNLGPRTYTVLVGRGLLAGIGASLTGLDKLKGNKVAVITDSTVGPLYAPAVLNSLEAAGRKPVLITVPAGESSKSMGTVEFVLDQMASAGLDRKSFVVALGGGVIGDLGGFAASIYQRGIPYVQVPTTVLSQVDSSVGGKTGVNLKDAKNMVGAFHQPALVLADVDTLTTLSKREWNEGFAEIIKHAAIRDAGMLPEIEAVAQGGGDMVELIRRNVAIKASVVEADEFETSGLRALLNYGHTIGHAIEAEAGYGSLLHGEAISMGLVAAGYLSTKLSGLSAAEAERLKAALVAFQLPVSLPAGMTNEALLRRARMDKKYDQGAVRFVLLRSVGDAFVSNDLTEAHLIEAIEHLRQ